MDFFFYFSVLLRSLFYIIAYAMCESVKKQTRETGFFCFALSLLLAIDKSARILLK